MLIPISTISASSDPRVQVYANMRDAELAQRTDPLDPSAHAGLFIAEGELVVRRLIASRFQVHSVLTTPTRLATIQDAVDRLTPETPVFLVDQPVMDSIVGFSMHRGVLAVGVRGRPLALPDLLARTGPIVVLEDVNNHDNLGGIFRNVAALAGPHASVVLSPRCADPFYRKALRVSIGCVLSVPFARAQRWPEDLDQLRRPELVLMGLTPNPPCRMLAQIARDPEICTRRPVLLFGAEGPGLSHAALSRVDHRVAIEMDKSSPEVDSLNVHVAAGVALHHLCTLRPNP